MLNCYTANRIILFIISYESDKYVNNGRYIPEISHSGCAFMSSLRPMSMPQPPQKMFTNSYFFLLTLLAAIKSL